MKKIYVVIEKNWIKDFTGRSTESFTERKFLKAFTDECAARDFIREQTPIVNEGWKLISADFDPFMPGKFFEYQRDFDGHSFYKYFAYKTHFVELEES